MELTRKEYNLLTQEEKTERRRLQNCAKSKATYDKDPAKQLKRKQDFNEAKRLKEQETTRYIAPIRNRQPVVEEVVDVEIPSVNNIFNQKNTTKFIQEGDGNVNTKKKHLNSLKAMFRVTGIDNIGSTMTTFNTIKKGIESGLQLNGKPYALATKTGQIQVVLILIVKMNIPMTAEVYKKYDDFYREFKIQEADKTQENKTDVGEGVSPYKTYMERIEKKFGKDSKQYLIASIYDDVTARDNFGSLVIIPDMVSVVKKSQNYLVVPSNIKLPTKIVLQKFKTVGSMGVKTFPLTDKLSILIRQYILKQKLTDRLFPENKNGLLSSYIADMNKKIGIKKSGINYIRKSKVSEFLATKPTPEQRRIFSERTQHSPETQLNYNRMLI